MMVNEGEQGDEQKEPENEGNEGQEMTPIGDNSKYDLSPLGEFLGDTISDLDYAQVGKKTSEVFAEIQAVVNEALRIGTTDLEFRTQISDLGNIAQDHAETLTDINKVRSEVDSQYAALETSASYLDKIIGTVEQIQDVLVKLDQEQVVIILNEYLNPKTPVAIVKQTPANPDEAESKEGAEAQDPSLENRLGITSEAYKTSRPYTVEAP